MIVLFQVGIQKLLKSDLAEPGKTETRLKLQSEHRKNLREFDKKIVNVLDEKVIYKYCLFLIYWFINVLLNVPNKILSPKRICYSLQHF